MQAAHMPRLLPWYYHGCRAGILDQPVSSPCNRHAEGQTREEHSGKANIRGTFLRRWTGSAVVPDVTGGHTAMSTFQGRLASGPSGNVVHTLAADVFTRFSILILGGCI